MRAMKGHIPADQGLKFRDGDEGRHFIHAETTDRLLVFGTNGRFYTLSASNLPGGRGMGEPVRLMVDLPDEADIVALFVNRPGRKLLVASTAGNGFIVPEDEVVAQTRNGKQILNLQDGDSARVCKPLEGDHVAVVGGNGRFLVFAADELPEMSRGKGVRLQKYGQTSGKPRARAPEDGLSDVTTFNFSEGLTWSMGGGKTRHQADMSQWKARRASAGGRPPYGFPKDNLFT